MYYVYKITNLTNNKVYIGYTKNPNGRWASHKFLSASGKDGALYEDIRTFGVEYFSFEVISNLDTSNEALWMEKYYQKTYKSYIPNGYNKLKYENFGAIEDIKKRGCTKLKEHLLINGRSNRWVAKQLGVTPAHFSLILSGQRGLSKKGRNIIHTIWPDLDITDDVELLPEEKTAQDKEKAKNLFKD